MTSTFTPRPAGLNAKFARRAAAVALLKTLPPGTEVVFAEQSLSPGQNATSASGPLSGGAIAFVKRFSNRDGLGKLSTRTVREGNVVRSYVSAEPAYHGKGRATTFLEPVVTVTASPSTTATQSTTTVSVNTVPAKPKSTPKSKPVANPDRTKVAKKTGKRRYVRRADQYAKHLAKGERLLSGGYLPLYHSVMTVSTYPWTNSSATRLDEPGARQRVQNRFYNYARELNKLAADRPFSFRTRTQGSGVRIDVVLD